MHLKGLCTVLKINSCSNMPIHKNVSQQNSQFNIFKDNIKVRNFTSMVAHI